MENVFSEQEEDYERSYLGSTASRTFSTNNFMPMQSRPPPGYTGHLRSADVGRHVLRTPMNKFKIRGYTGHIEGSQHVCGTPIIPNEEEQRFMLERRLSWRNRSKYRLKTHRNEGATSGHSENNEDLQEKYLEAMEQLWKRHQTPQMLLRMLQGKVSERFGSFADQAVRVRKIFESYSTDESLDVYGFRKCLEQICCQLDEVQSLALFAYFDEENEGKVSWLQMADNAMVPNPKSGSILPKPITATLFNEDWSSLSLNMYH